MFTLDLSKVDFPKVREEAVTKQYEFKAKKLREQKTKEYAEKGLTGEEATKKMEAEIAEELSDFVWNPAAYACRLVAATISNYFEIKWKEKGKPDAQIVAPWDIRRQAQRANRRFEDMEGTTVRLDKQNMDFLLEAFTVDGVYNDDMVCVYDFLSDAKLGSEKGTAAESAEAPTQS